MSMPSVGCWSWRSVAVTSRTRRSCAKSTRTSARWGKPTTRLGPARAATVGRDGVGP